MAAPQLAHRVEASQQQGAQEQQAEGSSQRYPGILAFQHSGILASWQCQLNADQTSNRRDAATWSAAAHSSLSSTCCLFYFQTRFNVVYIYTIQAPVIRARAKCKCRSVGSPTSSFVLTPLGPNERVDRILQHAFPLRQGHNNRQQ